MNRNTSRPTSLLLPFCRGEGDLHPNLIWSLRLMEPHTQYRMKRFISYLMTFSEESRQTYQVALKMTWEGKEIGLWLGAWGEGFCVWAGACVFEPMLEPKGGASHFLVSRPRSWAEGEEGGMEHESCQQSNIQKLGSMYCVFTNLLLTVLCSFYSFNPHNTFKVAIILVYCTDE